MPWPSPQILKIKKCKNNRILSKTCFQNPGVILQNFPRVMSPDPPRLVVPSALTQKLICDIT